MNIHARRWLKNAAINQRIVRRYGARLVSVSGQLNGSGQLEEVLLRHHGHHLSVPVRSEYFPQARVRRMALKVGVREGGRRARGLMFVVT